MTADSLRGVEVIGNKEVVIAVLLAEFLKVALRFGGKFLLVSLRGVLGLLKGFNAVLRNVDDRIAGILGNRISVLVFGLSRVAECARLLILILQKIIQADCVQHDVSLPNMNHSFCGKYYSTFSEKSTDFSRDFSVNNRILI